MGVGPPGLPTYLAISPRHAPQVRLVEDCWQNDPRLIVRHRVGSHRLRVHPGAYSDPSQTLRILASTAAATDDFVLGRHGCGAHRGRAAFGLGLVLVPARYAVSSDPLDGRPSGMPRLL